tara:strand:- start:754 stop:981 length:228 start_codon:yes stop_codon:yes gene_type:complete
MKKEYYKDINNIVNDMLEIGNKKTEKTYDAVVSVEWATTFEATSKKDFIEKVKEQWKQDYNIELVDDEIKVMEKK